MNQQTVLGFDASIAALVKHHPRLAFSKVPTSITSYYGESLGWPDWLLEGTNFPSGPGIPREASLVDGLRAMANLIVCFGEAGLAKMMLEWPRFPLEAEALAAPDLAAALRVLVDRVNRKNETVALTLAQHNGALVIRIGINPDLGAFRGPYEQFTLTLLFLVIRSFLGMSAGGRDLLAQIGIGRFHSDRAVDGLLPCRTIPVHDAAMLVIPPEALRCVGPDFKPELWEGVLAALETASRPEQTQDLNEVLAIADLVGRSLRDHGLVLPFAQIARSLGRSERTLSRSLAEGGKTYREIVDEVRMSVAQDMLAHSNASVRDISARLGYSDDSAFVRAFRRCFGMSPARWRKVQD